MKRRLGMINVKIYILDIMISKQLALVLFFFILVIVAQAGNEPDTDLNNNIQKSGIVSTVNRQQSSLPN
ncbi:unnamed protein product [Rotaria sordida]|uniref:Uncharacterized protein n=1 Tax=Rotaria sordida TaxID=392033 RepID=A0A814FB65_9BILA|nr:unnamed protein product [Rotaria sordida]